MRWCASSMHTHQNKKMEYAISDTVFTNFFPCIVYDASRTRLLRGRSTMLKLCAAQLKEQKIAKPVWIDLGGGTGMQTKDARRMC